MAKAPGTIRKRGNGWQAILRVNGKRFQYGPRSTPFLGTDPTRNEVEEWVWRELDRLKKSAKRDVDGLFWSLRSGCGTVTGWQPPFILSPCATPF